MSSPLIWLYEIIKAYDVLFNIPRVGWSQRGVSKSEAEDIGKHTLITAAISMSLCLLYKSRCGNIDCEKIIIMSLIHDLPEALIGNIAGNVRKLIPNLRDIELRELEEILAESPYDIKRILIELFKEYRQSVTTESKLVILADKLATLLRALNYYENGNKSVIDLVKHYSSEVTKLCNDIACEPVKQEVLKIVDYAVKIVE